MPSKSVNQLEKIFFIFAIFLLTDKFKIIIGYFSRRPYIKYFANALSGTHDPNIAKVVQYWSGLAISIYIDIAFWLILLLLIMRPDYLQRVLEIISNNIEVLALLALACASWLWSVNPNATLNGLYFVVKITAVGLYLSQRYSSEEILEILVWVIVFASIFSILLVWKVPAISKQLGGEWRGIYISKNSLGRLMAFGNITLLIYWFQNESLSRRLFSITFFTLTGMLLVLSRSTTSLILLGGIYSGFIVYAIWKGWFVGLNLRLRWLLVTIGFAIVSLGIWKSGVLLDVITKTPTLNGRKALWEILWTGLQKRPILGFGYEAFWPQFPNGIYPPGWVELPARHAHNGYIEIALGLGFLGLILYLIALARTLKNSILLIRQKKQIVFIWPLLALIYLILSNITYSVALGFPDFHWVLFIVIIGIVSSEESKKFPKKIQLKATEIKHNNFQS